MVKPGLRPVSLLDPVPSARTTASVSFRATAIHLESGDQVGKAWLPPSVTRRFALPFGRIQKTCQPGPVAGSLRTYAIRRPPSGDQAGSVSKRPLVTRRARLPSAFITQIWNPVPGARPRTKATCLRSGDQAGRQSS